MVWRFTFLMHFIFSLAGAQPGDSSSAILEEVGVTDMRLRQFSPGLLLLEFDSLTLQSYRNADLGTLLSEESTVYVKSYGPGGLSTTSLRGGNASHTATIWNGFNLNSSMNSTIDLSLLPVGFMEEIILQKGASTALWGSGALGGAVLLSNRPSFKEGFRMTVSEELGSFGLHSFAADISYGNDKYSGDVKFLQRSADQDFPLASEYQIASGRKRNINSRQEMRGVLTSQYFRIRPNQLLSAHYWYQSSDRQFAPTLFEAPANTKQIDESHRASVHYSHVGKNQSIYLRTAFFDEYLLFYSDHLGHNRNNSQSWINEVEWKYSLHDNHLLALGINQSNFWAQVDEYSQNAANFRTALFGSYRFISVNRNWQSSVNLRQTLTGNERLPLTFTLGGQYQWTDRIISKINLSKVYRQPSLNDLYWDPGGNPDLRPEDGYSAEMATELQWETGSGIWEFTAAGFYRNIKNWILWTPGPAYWSPENLLQVESYGLETESEYELQIGKFRVEAGIKTSYVRSYNLRPKDPEDNTLRRQLIYVPLYSAGAKLGVEYAAFRLRYLHNYTGYTYTATDHSQFIAPYDPASLRLEYQGRWKKCSFTVWVQAKNLYDEVYQVMRSRPMPMRYFNFGVRFDLR